MDDDDVPGVPEWVVTYGDMMSLLLTFFIMLVSLSEVVADKKYRAILDAIQKYIGYRTAPLTPPGTNFPLNSMVQQLDTLGSFSDLEKGHGGVKTEAPEGTDVRVFRKADGRSFLVGDPIPFDRAESGLSASARKQLSRIARELAGKPNKIEIHGHASPEPLPPGSQSTDKTVLSYLRGRSVMRFLAGNGVRPDRMRISCHGDVQPRIRTGDNRSMIHDRVEIHIIDKFAAYYRGPTDTAQ